MLNFGTKSEEVLPAAYRCHLSDLTVPLLAAEDAVSL